MLGQRSFSVFTGCSTREVRTYLEGLKVNLRLHVDHTLAFRAQSLSLSITELAATALFGKWDSAVPITIALSGTLYFRCCDL